MVHALIVLNGDGYDVEIYIDGKLQSNTGKPEVIKSMDDAIRYAIQNKATMILRGF